MKENMQIKLNSLFLIIIFAMAMLNAYMIDNNTHSLEECSDKLYEHLTQQEAPKGIR